ncbi:MAG: hypothetical protein ACN2B6_11020 [Rickettsiales bacterium]
MKYLVFIPTLLMLAAPANATMKFTCERFKSSCTGTSCEKLYLALHKDVDHKILTMRKTQLVEYEIERHHAKETLVSLRTEEEKDVPLVIDYKHVETPYGKLILTNKDRKGDVKEKTEIEPTSGLYRYYLIHTDGSIKDVPVGEPYAAYFGWCEDNTAKGDSIMNMNPVDAPVPAQKPETAIPDVIAPAETIDSQ